MGRRVYVANAGEDSISVICPERLLEVERIVLPQDDPARPMGPRRIWVQKHCIYGIAAYTSDVFCLPVTGEDWVYRSEVGAYPTGIYAYKGMLYISCGESDAIWQVEQETGKVISMVSTGMFPNALSGEQDRLIVANIISCDVKVYRLPELTLITQIGLQGPAYYAALQPGKEQVCVAHSFGEYKSCGQMSIFSLETHKPVLSLYVGGMPTTMRFFEQGNKVLVANTGNRSVSLIDLNRQEKIGCIPVDGMADDMLVLEELDRILISNMTEDAIVVADGDGALVGTIKTGKEPRGLASD